MPHYVFVRNNPQAPWGSDDRNTENKFCSILRKHRLIQKGQFVASKRCTRVTRYGPVEARGIHEYTIKRLAELGISVEQFEDGIAAAFFWYDD